LTRQFKTEEREIIRTARLGTRLFFYNISSLSNKKQLKVGQAESQKDPRNTNQREKDPKNRRIKQQKE
jgi:hypothetical protein